MSATFVMKPEFYKNLEVSRGYNYHYYRVAPRGNLPNVLFLHGWPSVSRDWRYVVYHFEQMGYGVIVPDMLGYGGTSKPTDYMQYQYKDITKDLIDILDAEKVESVIPIGHNWGAHVVSRLGNFYPERCMAYATLNLAFHLPTPDYDYDGMMKALPDLLGYAPFGYWKFCAQEGASKLIEDNIESFLSALHPRDIDMKTLRATFMDIGGLENALRTKWTGPLAKFVTPEEKQIFIDNFTNGRMAAPLCWYQIVVKGGRNTEDASIPADRLAPPIAQPIFFGAAKDDLVCPPKYGFWEMDDNQKKQLHGHNVEIHELEGDHWLMYSPDTADATAQALLSWIQHTVLHRAAA